jgi:hypothetical protein
MPHDESGSSVVEMLVAAALTVTALGVLLGNVVVPLEHLAGAHAPDMSHIELRTAGEEFARTVRAARPGIAEPAVIADGDDAIVLRIVDGGVVQYVRIAFETDALLLERRDRDGMLVVGSRRTLASGLAPGVDRLVVHHDPVDAVTGRADVAAVELRLKRGAASLERMVAVRMSTHLDGAGGW